MSTTAQPLSPFNANRAHPYFFIGSLRHRHLQLPVVDANGSGHSIIFHFLALAYCLPSMSTRFLNSIHVCILVAANSLRSDAAGLAAAVELANLSMSHPPSSTPASSQSSNFVINSGCQLCQLGRQFGCHLGINSGANLGIHADINLGTNSGVNLGINSDVNLGIN